MNIKELRIGNLVNTERLGICTVAGLSLDKGVTVRPHKDTTPDFFNVGESPVKLTHDFLFKKLGAKKFPSGGFVEVDSLLLSYAECEEAFVHNHVYLKHVHDLQNYFFYTQGKELKIID